MKILTGALGASLILGMCLAPTESFAFYPRHRYFRVAPHHFFVRDVGLWRRGRWYHGMYDGAFGWWWMVGATWYFYERPMYPYPEVTVAPAYYVEAPAEIPQMAQPQAQVQVMPPPPAPIPAGPAPVMPQAAAPQPPAAPVAQSQYYYCSNPAGYYPYVANCPVGWTTVPATPPR